MAVVVTPGPECSYLKLCWNEDIILLQFIYGLVFIRHFNFDWIL